MKTFVAALFAAFLLVVPAAQAVVIGYDIAWSGSNNFTMTGTFSFDDADAGDGLIDASEVLTLTMEGFDNGVSVGTFDLANGIVDAAAFNFNFDTVSEIFLTGGTSGSGTGQCWNCDADDIALGFVSGNVSQLLLFNGSPVPGSDTALAEATLTATAQEVDAPGTALTILPALATLAIARRRRRR